MLILDLSQRAIDSSFFALAHSARCSAEEETVKVTAVGASRLGVLWAVAGLPQLEEKPQESPAGQIDAPMDVPAIINPATAHKTPSRDP
jgi:hypothetical protein